MIKIKYLMNDLLKKLRAWIKSSPDDALVAISLTLFLMFVAITFAFISMYNKGDLYGELPTPAEYSKQDNGWQFLSREGVGKGYCDTFKKGLSYKVQCYAKDENGKWYLNNVY